MTAAELGTPKSQTGGQRCGILRLVSKTSIDFLPVGRRGMRVTLRTEKGWQLAAWGDLDQGIPEFAGDGKLQRNLVVAVNLWAFACAEKEGRITRDSKLRDELKRRARTHADLVGNVADLVDEAGVDVREGWCSACFEHTVHRKVDAGLSVPAYLCEGCGARASRLSGAVQQFAYDYHSRDDKVLRFFYSLVQGGAKAAGSAGMTTKFKDIRNVDVTSQVPDHSAYCKNLSVK